MSDNSRGFSRVDSDCRMASFRRLPWRQQFPPLSLHANLAFISGSKTYAALSRSSNFFFRLRSVWRVERPFSPARGPNTGFSGDTYCYKASRPFFVMRYLGSGAGSKSVGYLRAFRPLESLSKFKFARIAFGAISLDNVFLTQRQDISGTYQPTHACIYEFFPLTTENICFPLHQNSPSRTGESIARALALGSRIYVIMASTPACNISGGRCLSTSLFFST
jgi:hypothetical protein